MHELQVSASNARRDPVGNRAHLVRCVADGLYRQGRNEAAGSSDLLALTVAKRVVGHLDRLGFVVLTNSKRAVPEA